MCNKNVIYLTNFIIFIIFNQTEINKKNAYPKKMPILAYINSRSLQVYNILLKHQYYIKNKIYVYLKTITMFYYKFS